MSHKLFDNIDVRGISNFNKILLPKNKVSQVTAITSGVTLNSPSGIILTTTANLATNGNTSFVVSNSHVNTGSIILANQIGYSGSQGAPFVSVRNVTQGSFSINLKNVDTINPLNGNISIAYAVL